MVFSSHFYSTIYRMDFPKKQRKINPLTLLILLSFFAYSSVWVVNKYNVVNSLGIFAGKNIASLTTFYSKISKVDTKSSSESILGCTDGTTCEFSNQTPFEPICLEDKSSVNLVGGTASSSGGGLKVSKSSVLEPSKITIPQTYNGSKYFQDSRMAITNEFQSVKPLGEAIIFQEARARLCAPGQELCGQLDDVQKNAQRGAFAVNTSVKSVSEDEGQSGRGEAVVSFSLERGTPQFIEEGSYNPDKTNKLAAKMTSLLLPPGGEIKLSNDTNKEVRCQTLSEINSIQLQGAENFTACVNTSRPTISNVIGNVSSLEKWLACLSGEASCEKELLLGIQVDAVLGDPEEQDCDKNSCGNKYFKHELARNLAPGNVETLGKQFYITTSCKVLVDGREKETNCLWDSSIDKDYYIQKNIHGPGDPNFPRSFTAHTANIQYEAEQRAVKCF